jgi:hypothetical protein
MRLGRGAEPTTMQDDLRHASYVNDIDVFAARK